MKMNIQQNLIKSVFNDLSKFRGKDIMQHIHLHATESLLTFRATDGEVTFIKKVAIQTGEDVNAEIHEAGELLLPPKLDEITRKLASGMISITTLANGQIEVKQAKTSAKVNVVVGEDFPGIPNQQKGEGIKFNAKVLAALVTQTAFAAADDNSRPILKSIHMVSDEKSFKVVATDRHRISQNLIPKPLKLPALNIPAKQLVNVVAAFEDNESLSLFDSGNHVLLESEDKEVYIRQLDGKYPDISKLLENLPTLKVKINRKDLINSIDRAGTFAKDDKRYAVTLEAFENRLSISSGADNGSIEEEIVASSEGELFKLTMNSKYLLDALKVFSSEEVTLHLQSNLKPVFISSDKEPNITELILPMRTA
ncbi:DNA polymerase III subunit beta [Psychrobacillus sp. FSL H8-0484]|uniref:DNA polymerase III subunit beta n=1 Tax=Psychrobacillus sp. FSL H8-0484 TaxID=2921390 RepID=UPI0030F4CB7C